jgi:hypothetical protein
LINLSIKKRRIAADGCRRIAVCSNSVHGLTADLICAIAYNIKSGQRPQEVARLSQLRLHPNDINGEVDFVQFPMA